MSADREDFGTAADEQNLVAADVADELAVDKIRERDAFSQIRPTRWSLLLALFLGHRRVPPFPTVMRRR